MRIDLVTPVGLPPSPGAPPTISNIARGKRPEVRTIPGADCEIDDQVRLLRRGSHRESFALQLRLNGIASPLNDERICRAVMFALHQGYQARDILGSNVSMLMITRMPL